MEIGQTSFACATRGTLEITLSLKHAGERTLQLHWESVGPQHAPTIFVAGGISAGRHAVSSEEYPYAGWWQQQMAINVDKTRLISFDWIGADGLLDAPIDPQDQAQAIAVLLAHLGIEKLQAFIGYSYGAMVGLQFAAAFPAKLDKLIAVSGTHRPHPYASAWRSLQRQILSLGQLQCSEEQGLALARQLGVLSYRSPGEFAERFTAPASIENNRVRVAAEDYLDHCGAKYVARASATAFLRLSESIDLQNVNPSKIKVATALVSVEEDQLIPHTDALDLFERLPKAQLHTIRSVYGHDAFLKEHNTIAAIVAEELCTGELA